MHNNIMTSGSRDRPPMLAMGRYAQCKSRVLRYINTRPNGDALRKCILQGPYIPSIVIIPAVPTTYDSLAVLERTAVETILNIIRDEIYSIIDACKTTHDMWIAIERLQQGESLNIQDVKTNLFWEFDRFTYHDEESMESYYSRFYKMMNEMIRDKLTIATMQVNYQKEVNEIRAERIAKNTNPLALVVHLKKTVIQNKLREIRICKNLALIAKYFKKIYKPINNNFRTSSNSRNQNVDTSLRYKNDNQIGQFGNQRRVTIDEARETIGSQEVPTAYLRTNTEPLEQVQYDAGYNVFANKRQHSKQPEFINNICVVEKAYSNVIPDSPDMCDNEIQTNQNAKECDDERVALANLIANLTLDIEENKKIVKQLKKANASLTQELKECKSNLEESNTTRDSYLIAL
ncbi:hypothetical protein Tco_1137628 [Tanacetum coccineum]